MFAKSSIDNKRVIFVDFFDTIMHRHIHPLILKKKADEISLRAGFENPQIYRYLEIGCQYPNERLLNKLTHLKEKGKRIYIVSDFHVGKEEYLAYLKAKGIDSNLFDDFFISCECGCSKAEGGLYAYVLDRVGVKPDEVLMIGDNKKVDGQNASKYGIDSKIIPHWGHKLLCQIIRFLNYDYSKRAVKKIRKDLYHYGSPYSEYSLLFYLSTRELYNQLHEKCQKNVIFLAREGHFLKRAFDAYQDLLVLEENRISTSYLKCSRRAAQSLMPESLRKLEDKQISIYDYLMAHGFSKKEITDIATRYGITEGLHNSCQLNQNTDYLRLLSSESFCQTIKKKRDDNIIAGKQYFESFKSDEVVNLVDIGWRGRMQDTIGNILGKNTMGYYVGLNDSELELSNRIGLLFTSCPLQGATSPYSQILKANIQLYEQLTAAPHGSAVGYKVVNGGVIVEEDWVENERALYYDRIESIQKELLLNILAFAVWCADVSYKQLVKLSAKTVLSSGMFADKSRLRFINSLDKGFVWNFDKQTKGINYNKKEANIKLDIITSPEKYTRFFVKIQRHVAGKGKLALLLYYPFALLVYGYTWGLSRIKNL